MPKARIVKVDFGKDAEEELWKYVEETSLYWKSKFRNFHENRLPEFARIYKGTPLDEVKNTPWPNAANNVIQVVGTHCDQLLSRAMSIYMVEPVWQAKILGEIEGGEEQKNAFESFMGDMALSSEELDLYRTEEAWFSGAIRNGTGMLKAPWEYQVEDILINAESIDYSIGNKPKFDEKVMRDSPKPSNIPLNKFLTDNSKQKLEDSEFKCHIVTLTKKELLARKEMKIFSDKEIDKIIQQPDRSQEDVLQQYIESRQGLDDAIQYQNAQYDLYECWVKYWHNGHKFSLVCIHHPFSKTRLIAFYNYYPGNMDPFEDAKLAYDDENWLGYGFAEMLQGYQEEISTTHNQRTDAGSLNNTTAFRVNPSSKLHSILTFYPGVLVPANKDEIERLDTSNPHANDTTSETLTNAYAKERSGIDPAVGGTGGGVVNSKRGIYSSQGTFAVLQQQNNRTSLRTSDMRAAHARLGQKLAVMYANFGVGTKISKFGDKAAALEKAFANIKSGKLGMSMRAATASINKEMEKQNDILLSGTLQQMYSGDAQLIQALVTPGCPPELGQYYIEVMKAKQALMRSLLRAFGREDVESLIPVPEIVKGKRNEQFPGTGAGQNNPQNVSGQGQNAGIVPVSPDGAGISVPQ